MTKGQFNYILALVVCLSGFSLAAAAPCSGTAFGTVPHPDVCYKYYVCVLWIGTERTCSADQVFNEYTKECEPGNQETCEIWSLTTTTRAPETTQTTPHPVTTTGSTANPHNPCHGLSHGERVPHPDCHRYYSCILQVPVPHTCDDDHIFDKSSAKCVPGDPETCEIFATTTTGAPITTTQSETTLSTTHEPPTTHESSTSTHATTHGPGTPLEEICRGVFFGARAHPESFTLFVGCVRGAPMLFECYQGEAFNPTINECVMLPTTTTPEPTTTTPEPTDPPTTTRVITTTLPPNLDDICKGIHNQYVEHPDTCSLYVFCWEGYYQVMQCPEFKIFDIKIESCRAGDQKTCKFIDENTATATEPTPPPTTEATTTEPEVTTMFNPCAGIARGNVPNDDSCFRFFQCISSNPFPRSCDDGHIFHSVQLICVPGNQDTCSEE